MAVEVKVPNLGESISEVQISQWLKQEGDWVEKDEDVVELETDKATVQVPSPEAGRIDKIIKHSGDFAEVGEVIAQLLGADEADAPAKEKKEKPQEKEKKAEKKESSSENAKKAAPSRSLPDKDQSEHAESRQETRDESKESTGEVRVMPAAQRLLDENDLKASEVEATGPGGRLLKEDVLAHLKQQNGASGTASEAQRQETRRQPSKPTPPPTAPVRPQAEQRDVPAARTEEVKPMSMIRRTIAARLVNAQQSAALLTTFNEIDMQPVMDLRRKYRDQFLEKHGVKLGFMSFFAKAAIEALKRFPEVNAEVRDNKEVVYRHYYDIGIAIGGGKGLVVPVLRNVERMSFAEIEQTIGELADKAQANKLVPDELQGGTFTISNGGVYGSLLSTPIVNPPQSGILGLHAIQERPIAVDGKVVIRPMMYVALTYDHRIVDGREAVTFLRTIKEVLEEPARLFLEV
ncbi:MAG: 2-oxoglutarate dehydrogenase complex dihydrolipoyllysine-residue succinyltransferase [Pirellulales bacterium]